MWCATTALVACKGAPIPPELGQQMGLHSSSALRAWCAPGPHGSLSKRGQEAADTLACDQESFCFSSFVKILITRVRVVSTAVVIFIDQIGGFSESSFKAPTESTAAEFCAKQTQAISHTRLDVWGGYAYTLWMNTGSCISSK